MSWILNVIPFVRVFLMKRKIDICDILSLNHFVSDGNNPSLYLYAITCILQPWIWIAPTRLYRNALLTNFALTVWPHVAVYGGCSMQSPKLWRPIGESRMGDGSSDHTSGLRSTGSGPGSSLTSSLSNALASFVYCFR